MAKPTNAPPLATITTSRSSPTISPAPAVAPVITPTTTEQETDQGDHERMAHIVLEGYKPDEGDYVQVGPSVVEGIVNGTAVRALCGKVWVPDRNPAHYPLCPTCKEIAAGMGWKLPAS